MIRRFLKNTFYTPFSGIFIKKLLESKSVAYVDCQFVVSFYRKEQMANAHVYDNWFTQRQVVTDFCDYYGSFDQL
jgi:hypothetical protein